MALPFMILVPLQCLILFSLFIEKKIIIVIFGQKIENNMKRSMTKILSRTG